MDEVIVVWALFGGIAFIGLVALAFGLVASFWEGEE